jgi:hypothetical protein
VGSLNHRSPAAPHRTGRTPFVMYPALQKPRHASATTAENVLLHAGDRTTMALALCTQSIPPASKRLGLLPPFAMWTAFPSSDYYEGSAPHHALRRSPRIACIRRRTRCGSHVPVLNPWMVRCLLYPWRSRRETRRSRSLPGTGLFVPPRRDGKTHPDRAALPSHAITLRREVFH